MTTQTESQEPTEPVAEASSVASGRSPAQQLQESFARNLAARAGEMARRRVSVARTGRCLQSYDEFLSGIVEPTACIVLRTTAPESPRAREALVWVEVALPVAYVLIDSLLGGGGETLVPDRPLTSVEQRLLLRLGNAAGESLTRAWPVSPAARFQAQLPRLSQQSSPPCRNEDPVWVLAFQITVGGRLGRLRVSLPAGLVPEALLAGNALGGPLELTAATEDVVISREELDRLAVGDIITTDTATDGEVIVRVAGIPKYRARLGRCDGHRAVTITGKL
jgi:flagellar motor switch protein FliM